MRIKLLILSLLISGVTLAQQDPQFSQNMYNRLFPNPAFAGANGNICATLLGRQQWTGFDGAPATGLLSVHAPVPLLFGGVGLTFHQDQLGPVTTSGLKLAYAYRTQLSRFTSLPGEISAGIGLGFVSKTFGTDWDAIDDPNIDPSIPQDGISDGGFDMDFGLYYSIPEQLYFGVSVMHITQSDLQGTGGGQNSFDFNYEVRRNYYIMGGYTYPLNAMLVLEPSTFIKTDGFSTQIDINCNATYNDFLWGGLTYRLQDAVVPIIGVKYDIGPGRLIAGYSYDVTTNQLRTASSGSHEIMLNYCFNITRKPKIQMHKTVRFL